MIPHFQVPRAFRVRSFVLLLGFVSLVAVSPAPAAEEGRLSCKVVDVDGNPVEGITVMFVPPEGSAGTLIEHKTNKKGKFTDPAMLSGVYMPDIAEREWIIKKVSLVVRGPDGQKAQEFSEEIKPGVAVPPFTAMPFMRASMELVLEKGEARPTEAQIAAAKDASGLLSGLNDLFQQAAWDQLVTESARVIRENADLGDDLGGAYYLQGVAHWQTGDLGAAAESLSRAAEMIPDQEGIRGTLGSVLLDHARTLQESGDDEAAKAAYAEAAASLARQLELTPDSLVYLTNRVIALEGAGDLEAALGGLEALIAADAENPRYYMRKAEILTEQGRADEAVAVISAMPAGNAAGAEVIYNAAVEMWNTGNMEGVVAAMDKAISINPDMPDLYRLKGRALISSGNDADGIAALKEYLSRVPEDHPGADADRALVEALGGGGS
jgi:tetratricopeptide (TPR) repeat protein